MISGTNNERWENHLLVALLAAIVLFTAFHEGYLSSMYLLFWISFVGVVGSGIFYYSRI